MEIVTQSDPGFKVRYHLGDKGEAMYGGDGFVQPAMSLSEAERLRQSLIDSLGVHPDSLELVPLGDVENVEASGPSKSYPIFSSLSHSPF